MTPLEALVMHALACGIDAEAAQQLGELRGVLDRLQVSRAVGVSPDPRPTNRGVLVPPPDGPPEDTSLDDMRRAWFDFATPEEGADYHRYKHPCLIIAVTGNGYLKMVNPIHVPGSITDE